jgi:uncharacterized SAM-dependent methyltransferase
MQRRFLLRSVQSDVDAAVLSQNNHGQLAQYLLLLFVVLADVVEEALKRIPGKAERSVCSMLPSLSGTRLTRITGTFTVH